jgi:TM2 domain-containing membrane protein YozV
LRALIVALVLVSATRSAIADSPAERLTRARNDFRAGKYEDAKVTLNYLLYPAPGRLADENQIVEAHVLFGVALFETGERKDANREIEAALYIDKDYELDPQLFSSDAVAWFNETKAAKDARDKVAEDARKLAEEKERLRKALEERIVYEKRSYWVNFMPFGAGQFQNGQTGKGIAFAATEAAAAGTTIVIFGYLFNKYGYGGQVPREDAAEVRRLQQVAIGANVVFYGVAIWGVVDALRNYKAETLVRLPPDLRDELQPNDDDDKDDGADKPKPKPKAKFTPPAARLHVHPLPFPDGAGVGLTWEY